MSGQTYEQQGESVQQVPRESLVRLTHIIYLLHAISATMGVLTSASVVGSFVFGLPSIVAVIINYVQRSEVRGTYLDSHFGWQIRTFWYAAGAVLLIWFLVLTLLGIPLAILLAVATGVWIIYRVARGWLALGDARPMPI